MKLLILTIIVEHKEALVQLLKKAHIDRYSTSEIKGHKEGSSSLSASNWFSNISGDVNSEMLFSFVEEEKIKLLFELIKEFNAELPTNNPIKGVVLPIESYI